ncbi:hypothetical protein L208DRAFT_173834 [Tricholoma matsutake]|nr:hypothetical protein L208DRAFT_173834 [Tricholoma matsutake 945]
MAPSRSAALGITLFGAVSNFAFTIQVLALWRSLKWEPESEWEASGDDWKVDGVKVIWGLVSGYFACAATVCIIGILGILKNKPSFLRFYRDYSIADFSFTTFFTAVATYASFHTAARTGVCEELSRHPELLRDMLEMGLNLENCERWLERAVLAFVAVMVVVIVIRLHFLLAVSNFYSHLIRIQNANSHLRNHLHSRHPDFPGQRIYILPSNLSCQRNTDEVELVYTPVPVSSLPKDYRANATEAWVSPSVPRAGSLRHGRTLSESTGYSSSDPQDQEHQRQQKHHRRHSHSYYPHRRSSRSSSSTRTGRIRLPIQPDEGLLPSYYDDAATKA